MLYKWEGDRDGSITWQSSEEDLPLTAMSSWKHNTVRDIFPDVFPYRKRCQRSPWQPCSQWPPFAGVMSPVQGACSHELWQVRFCKLFLSAAQRGVCWGEYTSPWINALLLRR